MLAPRYPQLLMVKAAGDFQGYLSFGIGLAARGGYHVSSLTGPGRVVIDFSHPRASWPNRPGLVTLVPGVPPSGAAP